MFNKDSSPTLLKCTFSGNSTSRVVFNESGGGMRNDNSHPKLTNCTFDRNLATDHGGGMFNYFSSKPTLINCRFIGNVAARQDGGGMFNGSGSRPTLTNCLFIGNIAKDGGGIRNWGADPTLVNCTFSENSASGNGGGVSSGVSWSKPKLTNCILWGNTDKDGVDESAQIYYGSPVVNYCCIQAWTGSLGGTGNIDADPCFVDTGYWDVNSVWVDGDYHLLPDSHCIDAGKPNYVPGPNETDLDGKPRIIGGRIDMGAYEFNHSPIADAGPDREVYAWTDGIAEVTLDGTNSYDDDGQPLTYYWNWTVDGNSYDANGVSPAIELPVGRHIIELIVNDGTDDSEPDLVTITAVPPMESQLRVFPQVIYRYSGMPKILAWVRLPEGVDKDQVDSDQPLLLYPAGSEAIHQHIFQHRRRGALQTNILAFFDKAELMEAVPGNGRAELQVVGQLQTGRYFYGSDTVWIIGWRRMPRRPFR